MTTLRPLRNHIVFTFLSRKTRISGKTAFQEETDWGFRYVNVDQSTGDMRWGIVRFVGPQVPDEIKPGMHILIDSLKWTNEVEFEDEYYSRTDYDQIVAIDEDTVPAPL